MAWVAAEPLSLEERLRKITRWSTRLDAGEDFSFAIGGELLGGCGLHRRIAPDGLELGYWARGDRTGQGVATDAARALVQAAFSVDGITHVEIHHDAANAASRRIPEKVGFTCIGERPDDIVAPAEVGIDVIWRLDRDPATRPGSPWRGGAVVVTPGGLGAMWDGPGANPARA
jgi:RimJ/RimL family protein N-acetyltransferase